MGYLDYPGLQRYHGKVQEEIDELKDDLSNVFPITAKQALLNLLEKVAYIDENGQDYYDALESVLFPNQYPKITVVYNPGQHVVYPDDSLNSLKTYLTVTYYATEESQGTIVDDADYSLSGTLLVGASLITATYLTNYQASFSVAVTDFSVFGLNKYGSGAYTVQSDNTFYCLITRDARGVIVTRSNTPQFLTKGPNDAQPTGTVNYMPFRIPAGATSVTYKFSTSGWSAVSILSLDNNGKYKLVATKSYGSFTGGTDLTVDISQYNNGTYFCVPFANDAEQDPAGVALAFNYS